MNAMVFDDAIAIEPPESISRHSVVRIGPEGRVAVDDLLAEEVPIALEYNGVAHAVMLATPSDLEEFALGFSLSEGILESASDLYDIEVAYGHAGITVRLRISSAAFMSLKKSRRSLAGRTGCGLCGSERLDQVLRPLPVGRNSQRLSAAAIRRALARLVAQQLVAQSTGGTHAAAWCSAEGKLLAVREDVGRHNALDKVIGALARTHDDVRDGFALISSRASVEMVQKAATMRMPALVAISAPTALAVRTAEQCGMTLVAFARGNRCVAYTNADNVEPD